MGSQNNNLRVFGCILSNEDFYNSSKMLIHRLNLPEKQEKLCSIKRRWTYQNEFLTGNIYASTTEIRDK